MNKLICTLFAAGLSAGSYCALAADSYNTEDLGTKDTPQQQDLVDGKSKTPMHRPMAHRDRMMHSDNMKMMDTNGDGMISKDEYMSYHEQRYGRMHQNSEGMVSMRDMEAEMRNGTTSGNKLQPSNAKGSAPVPPAQQ